MAGVTFIYAVVLLVAAVNKASALPAALKLNLEELFLVNECKEYKELSSTDRSLDYTNDTVYKCDTDLDPGWYRFTKSAGSHMVTQCVSHHHCSAIHPGWLNGTHPEVHEGVVGRKVCFQSDESCCHGTMKILVRNCGDFFVYFLFRVPCPFRYCGSHTPRATLPPPVNMTETPSFPPPSTNASLPNTTSTPHRIPDECDNYIPLTSKNRSATYYNPFYATGDYELQSGWYRFMGEAGTLMPDSCVPLFHCGTHSPGWLLGGYPNETTNHTVERTACFHWMDNCCYFKQDILVRQCEGYFVYKLQELDFKFLRYCGNGISRR